ETRAEGANDVLAAWWPADAWAVAPSGPHRRPGDSTGPMAHVVMRNLTAGSLELARPVMCARPVSSAATGVPAGDRGRPRPRPARKGKLSVKRGNAPGWFAGRGSTKVPLGARYGLLLNRGGVGGGRGGAMGGWGGLGGVAGGV